MPIAFLTPAATGRRCPSWICSSFYNPYISTDNRSFFRCPADRGLGWNFEWTIINGAACGIWTNNLLFPCSYYYYYQFYMDDTGLHPGSFVSSRKCAILLERLNSPLFCCQRKLRGRGWSRDHGPLVDVRRCSRRSSLCYRQLNPGTLGQDYNLDWTDGGLQGADLH